MSYPKQIARTYVNPWGNVAASGDYRSSVTQELSNMLPPWMHIRQNPRSVGQQFVSPSAMELKRLENTMNDLMRSKFISTARVDEIDILYRIRVPSNIDLTDIDASGIRCIAAPSGCSPSGVSQVWIKEVDNLKEFYYDVLPTRLEVISSGSYTGSVDGVSWNVIPSGIADTEEKHIDVWGTKHDITWCSAGGMFLKQDKETMEDYERYTSAGPGTTYDMDYYNGVLWCLNKHASGCYIAMVSTKTQEPKEEELDLLAVYDIGDSVDNPSSMSRILLDTEGGVWISDSGNTRMYEIKPRYDYYILDKDNRYIYLREDYSYSGVFVSNT